MVSNNLNREIGGGTFEYGEHEVRVVVFLQYTYKMSSTSLNNRGGKVHYRTVGVNAFKDGESEVVNENAVSLDVDTEPKIGLLGRLASLVTDNPPSHYASPRNTIPPLEEQLEQAVQPVLERLDEIYEFTTVDYDVDIEVGVNRMSHEISWVEVEDELDRINQEIDSFAETS